MTGTAGSVVLPIQSLALNGTITGRNVWIFNNNIQSYCIDATTAPHGLGPLNSPRTSGVMAHIFPESAPPFRNFGMILGGEVGVLENVMGVVRHKSTTNPSSPRTFENDGATS